MSTSDKVGEKAGEASMDEILASIRKIIADDPLGPRNGPDRRAVNPLLEPSATQLRAQDGFDGEGPLLPPVARFGDALRPSAAPRGRTFEDRELAELFDDAPTIQNSPPLFSAPPPAPSEPAAGLAISPTLSNKTVAPEISLASGASAEPAPASNEDPWAAWRTLRPHQQAEESEPPSLPDPLVVEAKHPESGVNGTSALEPVEADENLESNSNPGPAMATPPSHKVGFYPPLTPPPSRRQPASFSSVFPRSGVPHDSVKTMPTAGTQNRPATQVQSSLTSPSLGTRSLEQENTKGTNVPRTEITASATAAATTSDLAPAAAINGAAVDGIAAPASVHSRTATSAADATVAAANQALEKLAAGLSESPAPSGLPSQATGAIPAAVITPVSPPTAGVRSLDDMVSDMLRPMLEKWVESNMPRLMEKALRPVPAAVPVKDNDPSKV